MIIQRFSRSCLLPLLFMALTSCSSTNPQAIPQPQSIDLPETLNVSYKGMLSKDSGDYLLTTDEGTIARVEVTDPAIDLSVYLGTSVILHGSSKPTEQGGIVLRVSTVEMLPEAMGMSSSQSSRLFSGMCGGIAAIACDTGYECTDDLSDDCNPGAGGADCSGVCVPVVARSQQSSSQSLGSRSSSVSSSIHSSVSSSLRVVSSNSQISSVSPLNSSSSSTASQREVVTTMSQQKYDDSLWTQRYCTSHIGFCIPAHKNWYFKSFGATTTTKWHVEFSMSEIDELGQGVILLNLVSGSSENAGGVSGTVKSIGDDAVGYLDWRGDHFEISAHASLLPVIQFMLQHISEYVPAE